MSPFGGTTLQDKHRDRNRFNWFSLSSFAVFLAIIIIFTAMSENFLTFGNIYNIVINGAPLICMTMGMSFALLTGTMNLSVAAVAYMSGCVFAIVFQLAKVPLFPAIIIGLIAAVLMGLLVAFFVVKIQMNALVVTLGMMLMIRSIGKIVTQDRYILMDDLIGNIRQTRLEGFFDFPVFIFPMIGVIAFCAIFLTNTKIGRQIIAVGCNIQAARSIGIKTDRVIMVSILMSSLMAGIGGVYWVFTLGAVVPHGLAGNEFLVIAASVLGGVSLYGGRGSIFPGAVLGALIYLFLSNGLSIIGTSPFVIPLVRGTVIFIAIYVDSLRTSSERRLSTGG